jgi:caffeoyl-CoA O-methyltransferase
VETPVPGLDEHLKGLLIRHDEPVLLEMEGEAAKTGFPIVGRMVGVLLELLARSIHARRVFELGSGFGYSAYWFSRAIGPEGELHLTDRDPENERKAKDYLRRTGLDGPIQFHVGDSLDSLKATEGDFDIIFCDMDKGAYPAAWEAARDRVRPGGLYLCDNTLGWGSASVVTGEGSPKEWIRAVREHNRAVLSDEGFLTTIVPIRDGVMVALRHS